MSNFFDIFIDILKKNCILVLSSFEKEATILKDGGKMDNLDVLKQDVRYLSTKDRISVETFQLLQASRGVNVTISDICRAAGITKSTFYYYFHSIDEVIETFTDILLLKLQSSIPVIFQQHTCIDQALMAIRVIDEGVESLGVSVAASRYILHLKNGDYTGFTAEAGWELVLAIFRKAIEIGELPPDRSAEEVATSVYYIMRGINHTWCMRGGDFPFVEEVQKELRVYLQALSKSYTPDIIR